MNEKLTLSEQARVAVLEANIGHIAKGVDEIKNDVKELKGQFVTLVQYNADKDDMVKNVDFDRLRSRVDGVIGIGKWILGIITTLLISVLGYIGSQLYAAIQ